MTTSTTDAEAIARIIEAEIEHDIKGNIAWANGKRAANAILSYLASRREAQEPVAWRYRWKIDGEWVSWRVSERSQASEHLPSLEEYPLYLAPPAPAGDLGATYSIEHDGFIGTVIGSYTTREGKEGVVLQQVGTKVAHVYGRKWLKTPEAAPAGEVERPDWEVVYSDCIHTADRDDDLVPVTREALRLAASAIRQQQARDYYHNYGAALGEIGRALGSRE